MYLDNIDNDIIDLAILTRESKGQIVDLRALCEHIIVKKKVNNIVNVKEVCNLCNEYDIVLIAYENEKENTLKKELKNLKKLDKEEIKVAVIIGPEGGSAPEEIEMFEENGAKIITLGNRILRTETVALSVLSIIMYEL